MEKQKGFTLIELLVVIAIIALLLAIIAPSMKKAILAVEEITCTNNLHQYQIATEMYTLDNDEEFPNPWESLYREFQFSASPYVEQERFCRWHNPIYDIENDPDVLGGPYWPYLDARKVNFCKTFEKYAPKFGVTHMEGNGGASASDCIGPPFRPVNFSYSMNGYLNEGSQTNGTGFVKTQVRNPAQTFLWSEENMWVLPGYCDHVLNDTALLIDDGITDSFGSFHKISSAKLAEQISTGEYNGGYVNAIMVDGSIIQVTPEDNLRYRGDLK